MSTTKTIKKTKVKVSKPKKIKIQKPKLPFSIIRSLVETRCDFQDQRIRTQSRIVNNVFRNQIKEEKLQKYGIMEIFDDAESFEKKIEKMLIGELQSYPVWKEYLSQIYGIGAVLASGLISYIEDIKKFDNISKLWNYSGFGYNRFCKDCNKPTYVDVIFKSGSKTVKAQRLKPFDICPECKKETVPMIQKRQKGYMSNWNDRLKRMCWLISQSFQKQGKKSFYYNLYKQYREEEKQRHPKKIVENGKTYFNDGHLTNRAMRKVVKVFLAHVWVVWRQLDGVQVTQPYVKTLLGHDVIEPVVDKPALRKWSKK